MGLHWDIGNLCCLPAGYGIRTPYPPTKRDIPESSEWQWTLIPLAEQRALVIQPDEDSKAVRFRRHTICKTGIRLAQHTCGIHQIASLTKPGAAQGLGTNPDENSFTELSSITARGPRPESTWAALRHA